MGFQKGHSKIGGRKKGTPNKTSVQLREKINLLIENNWHVISDDLDRLSSKDRINVIIKLLDFVVPKLQSIEADSSPTIDFLLNLSDVQLSERIRELRMKD